MPTTAATAALQIGFFPDKAALGAMQDRFYGRVGALYGLSRGEKRIEGEPARRHKSVAEYKAESRRVQAELDEKAEQLESARAELAYANAELASARTQLAECKVQVEGFAARFERIKAELAQIAECLSVRGFLGSFKAKLAEFAENPICKAAVATTSTPSASRTTWWSATTRTRTASSLWGAWSRARASRTGARWRAASSA